MSIRTVRIWNRNLRKAVSADLSLGGKLIANRDWSREWERFRLVPLPEGNGAVAIQSLANNKYVAVEIGSGDYLVANRDHIGSWERFRIVRPGHGVRSIQSLHNHKWVVAEPGEDGLLRANRSDIGEWELFEIADEVIIDLQKKRTAAAKFM